MVVKEHVSAWFSQLFIGLLLVFLGDVVVLPQGGYRVIDADQLLWVSVRLLGSFRDVLKNWVWVRKKHPPGATGFGKMFPFAKLVRFRYSTRFEP